MKIFIIDDDLLSTFLTQSMLSLENNTLDVHTFLSGADALEILETSSDADMPDIIFLDLNMPFMEGWDFLDELQKLQPELNKKCAIYILTSSVDPSDIIKMKTYPVVTELLHKPMQAEEIQAILARNGQKAQLFKNNAFTQNRGLQHGAAL